MPTPRQHGNPHSAVSTGAPSSTSVLHDVTPSATEHGYGPSSYGHVSQRYCDEMYKSSSPNPSQQISEDSASSQDISEEEHSRPQVQAIDILGHRQSSADEGPGLSRSVLREAREE